MSNSYVTAGVPVKDAGKALVMIHGRGADPADILGLAAELPVSAFALIAPRAPGNTWYPYSFLAPPQQNQPSLDHALKQLADIEQDLAGAGILPADICWLGFSQGACLALEYTTRNAKRYGGVIAFTGGLIGDSVSAKKYNGSFSQTPVFIGSSDPDMHVPVSRVEETATIVRGMHANLVKQIYPGMGHTITRAEIAAATAHVFGS